MGLPNRKNIQHLTKFLPQLTLSEAGDALWANLWISGVRVGVKKVDKRIFELAETDYHREAMADLMLDFAKDAVKAAGKAAAAQAPATAEEADGLAKRVAKKITGSKKASKKKA